MLSQNPLWNSCSPLWFKDLVMRGKILIRELLLCVWFFFWCTKHAVFLLLSLLHHRQLLFDLKVKQSWTRNSTHFVWSYLYNMLLFETSTVYILVFLYAHTKNPFLIWRILHNLLLISERLWYLFQIKMGFPAYTKYTCV